MSTSIAEKKLHLTQRISLKRSRIFSTDPLAHAVFLPLPLDANSMVSSAVSHARRRGLFLGVAALTAMVLLTISLYSSPSVDAIAHAADASHPIELQQAETAPVPVQLSLSVAPGQVLLPGQAVSARVGPYTFNGIVAGQQPSLAYAQPLMQPQYEYQPEQAEQQPYAYAEPQMLQQPLYAAVQQPYAQPVSTGMPGFQLVDIQPQQQRLPLPSKPKTKPIDIPFFDAKHDAPSHAALVSEAKSVDKELKRIEQHVQLMNIKRAEEATERVQAQRQAALQSARMLRAQARRREEDRLVEQRAEQLVAQRLKNQKLTVLPAQNSRLAMYSVGSNGLQDVSQGTQITGSQSGRPFTGTVQSINVAPYSSYPAAATTTQFRIPSFTPQDELKARIAALQKRLKSVAVDNALFQQQNALEKRISDAEQKILAKTGSPLSYDQVVLRMNLLEKRLARLEKFGASAAQVRVVPASHGVTPDEAAEEHPLQAASIHGTTGDYFFSGTLAPAVAPADSPTLDDARPEPEEWHTTPRMVRACIRRARLRCLLLRLTCYCS